MHCIALLYFYAAIFYLCPDGGSLAKLVTLLVTSTKLIDTGPGS